ncbi:cytochrome c biogenesis protein CcdA [Candidatus Woesearchaeota archaeon]|nr:MAG: cytochrome c-type biogenesis protein [archaeon GW2011_AR18]MBS3161532.1 cytochrome c biogenesis protein CcdA [Candidatus Woesearchaeota archaeon]HIH25316.1 cytochrome c biogenesis protein CcdA [Nanoarchaeota archaeon]
MNKRFILYCCMFLLVISSVLALELPKNLQLISDYNNTRIQSLSLLIAFLGGILSLLSPCVLPLLPAFFAFTFKESKNITKMTFVFFLGLASVFVLFGVLFSFIGTILSDYRFLITLFAGIIILIFGIITMFGNGFSFMNFNYKPKNSIWSVFVFGVLFSVGFTPCIGPILSAILIASTTFSSTVYSAFLLFSYSLGFILPLFILSFFYDKYHLEKNIIFRGKEFNFAGFTFHTHKFIAGLLLIILGIIYIIDRGTYLANTINPFNIKELFYLYNDKVFNSGINSVYGNIIGAVLIILVLFIIIYFIKRDKK